MAESETKGENGSGTAREGRAESVQPVRVLVCGGRDYDGWATLVYELDKITTMTLLIHGGARGADTLAGKWAEMRCIPYCVFPANWKNLGKRAGPDRNHAMLVHGKPDLVIAFPGGAGTADMVAKARAAKVPVREV